MQETLNVTNVENLRRLQESNAKIFTWESGIKTTTPATREFYENNKEFYAVKAENKMWFFTLEGELKLITSSIVKLERNHGYIRVETANSVFHLLERDYKIPVKVHKTVATPVVASTRPINELTAMLGDKYPIEYGYGSRCSLFQRGLQDELITIEEFNAAANHYGRIWYYTGD